MPTFTLSQAAEETGKSKSVIFRALKNGTLSGHKDEKGEYRIDASELFRVYAWKNATERDEERSRTPVRTGGNGEENASLISRLEVENKLLHARLVDKDERISDLQAERDRVIIEKDQWHDQAQRLLLTYQPAARTPAMPVHEPGHHPAGVLGGDPSKDAQNANSTPFRVIAVAGLIAGVLSLVMYVFDAPIRLAMARLLSPQEQASVPVERPESAANRPETTGETEAEPTLEPRQSFPGSLPLPASD